MVKLNVVQVEFVEAGLSLDWSSVADPDVGNLGQLGEDYVSTFLDLSKLAMLKQIFKSFVFLLKGDIVKGCRIYISFFEGLFLLEIWQILANHLLWLWLC